MIYIYALCCPTTGAPRYIGKCKNVKARLAAHISKAKGFHTSHHCSNWIRLLIDQQLAPTIVVVDALPDSADWQLAETEAIKRYREAGHDLTNLTGGGDGFHDAAPDLLKRRGESRSRSLQNPETKAKFLAAVGPSHATPEARQNHKTGARSAWADPNKRLKMLAGMRTPEAVARRSEATRRRNADPVFAERHRQTMKALFIKPENRQQIRDAGAERWAKSRRTTP